MRSGELFAGVGGLGMAVDAVFGSTPAWFCEFDTAPSKVLAHRYPDVPNYGDVRQVVDPPKVDILAGGFPCQDVSLAGRRRGMKEGTRSGLWSEFARLIDTVRPDWVVIENVRGLLSADAAGDVEPCPLCVGDDPGHVLRALGAVLGDLAELGFDAEWVGLRASDVGAPHGRFRVFILAWPAANTSSGRSGGRAEEPTPSRRDDAAIGSDTGGDRGRTNPGLTLLPTPSAGNFNDGEDIDQWMERRERVKVATGNGNGMGMPLSIAARLLPMPRTTDMNGPGAHGEGGVDLRTAVAMVAPGTDWGPYAAAVARWESVLGRPAPSPVRMDGKGGKARLNPELTEWMMGWPAGWVTDPTIGLTRAEQLKACGNGVVPQQAAAALRTLLARPGVPTLTKERP